MAERRMFSKTVIDSDAFIEMPLSAQALYFHLSMRADDDGCVNNPRRIRNDVGAAEDDLKLLIAKRFVIIFESGVVVIKHWRIHNYIQSDRYKPTVYLKEKGSLMVCANKSYTECIHDVSNADTQVRLELGKDSLELGQGRGSVEPADGNGEDTLKKIGKGVASVDFFRGFVKGSLKPKLHHNKVLF